MTVSAIECYPASLDECRILLVDKTTEAQAIRDQIGDFKLGNTSGRDLDWLSRAKMALRYANSDINKLIFHIRKLEFEVSKRQKERRAREHQAAIDEAKRAREQKEKDRQARLANPNSGKMERMRQTTIEDRAALKVAVERLKSMLSAEEMQAIYAEMDQARKAAQVTA